MSVFNWICNVAAVSALFYATFDGRPMLMFAVATVLIWTTLENRRIDEKRRTEATS